MRCSSPLMCFPTYRSHEMILDPQADPGRRVWLRCPHCADNSGLYLLAADINLVWVQCGQCLRRWWHDTGVGRGRAPEHLFDVA
jgi:hypothetical protein